jgi:outer membrane receptor protein involved in Fe transport
MIFGAGAQRGAFIGSLFGTGSLLAISAALSQATAAAAAVAPVQAPVEEVLITGSLIAGTPAVGVPVTALGEEEFQESGAITISEMMRLVPVLAVDETLGTAQTSGANRQWLLNAEIHGIGGQSTATLLMVNGKRFPIQGTNLENVDPSIVPPLAVQRVDVLAAGASATYGSDAVAGVINIIMRRNFDGAITRASMGLSTDLGWESANFSAAQLFGRTWDNLADLGAGGITLSYEWWERRKVPGTARDYYTANFEPWGFDDRSALANFRPGVVSTGNPSAAGIGYPVPAEGNLGPTRGTRYCNNCYVLPPGIGWDFGSQAPGPTTTWAAVLANKMTPGDVDQEANIYEHASMNGAQRANSATMTLDQDLLENVLGSTADVALFADAFYRNRRVDLLYVHGFSPCARCLTLGNGQVVPTNNPYRPSGAPASINAHFSLGDEWVPRMDAGEISAQYALGFNFRELPFEWRGSAFFSASEETAWELDTNSVNGNMFNAAVGNTVASQAAIGTAPAHAAYSKPASIPYLNLFCDTDLYTCNAPQTLQYISAFRHLFSTFNVRELGVNFDGPVFELPGGTVFAAVGAQALKQRFAFRNALNETTFHGELVSDNRQFNKLVSHALVGQINVPVVGPDMNIPLIEELMIEGGYRFDFYDFDTIRTPKLQANWTVGWGLMVRGAFGSSFNTAPFGLIQTFTGVGSNDSHELINVPGATRAAPLLLNCQAHANAVPDPIVRGTVSAGSLQAYLNPGRFTCPAGGGLPAGAADPFAGTFNSVASPVGIDLAGSYLHLQGGSLGPETSDQWSLGVNFTPQPDDPIVGVLSGLSIDVSWWHIQRENLVDSVTPGEGANDPNSLDTANQDDAYATRYLVIPRPDLAITAPENAAFKALVDQIVATGRGNFDSAALPFVKFIDIGGSLGNQRGWVELGGLDFNFRYDWDMGAWGAWNARVSGSYELRNRSQDSPFSAVSSVYTMTRPDGTVVGTNSGHQLQRARFTLGWTDMNAHWSVVAAAQWDPHSFGGGTPPACFWRDDYGPGTAKGLCYPGAPYFPQPFYQAPAGTAQPDQRFAGTLKPSQMFFDLTLGYDTGEAPTNTYLRNIRFSLNIYNVLNRYGSAIDYDPRTVAGSPRIREGNDFQRTVSFSVTKQW